MRLPTKFLLPTQITKSQLIKYSKNADEVAQLGFGLGYKARWTVWMGVREFVQNAFDIITSANPKSRNELDEVELKYDAKRKIGYIIDQGSGIKFKNMFLSENKGNEWEKECLRGRFGEGMKYALLPLLRGGHQVLIRTVGADYHFASVAVGKKNEEFSLVHMLQTPNKNKQGTCITISGVDPNDFKYRFIPFLESDKPDAILLSTTDGCKARHALRVQIDQAGALYVRDIYVMKISSYFSYNFWFNDTTRVLDPNRNHLKVNYENSLEVGEEFFTLLEKIDTSEGREFWKTLFTLIYEDNTYEGKKFSFEWKYLDEYGYERLEIDKAEILFEVISEVVGTSNFSWSNDYAEGKTLEHFGVLDLRDKLPNLLMQVADFIKSPAQLTELNELKNQLIVLPPSSFKPMGNRVVKKIVSLHEMLVAMSEIMLNWNTDSDWIEYELNNIFLYTGDFREGAEGVAGFYSSAENSIYIHAEYLLDPKFFVKTFIHEMAHAYCQGCEDITEDFENALEEMAFIFYQHDNLWAGHLTKRIWNTLSSIQFGVKDQKNEHRADPRFVAILNQTEIDTDTAKREYRKTREADDEPDSSVAKYEKRKKKKQENKVLQLLRRADAIYNQGREVSLPSPKEARQILEEPFKQLPRPRKRKGKRAALKKWKDDKYIHRLDRNRAITRLRRGTPKDWQYLRDMALHATDKRKWRTMWQRRRI